MSPAPLLLLCVTLVAASACRDSAPQQEREAEDRNPALAAFDEDLRTQPLVRIEAALAALDARDDLRAIDQRRALDLAWRNRSPAQLEAEPDPSLEPQERERELELRAAWIEAHAAYSWDNLDPEAQLEPRPRRLSLTWLVLARYLPLARNQQPFEIPWVRDYFERKAWYNPRDGALYLSYIDRVQMDRLEQEIAAIDQATLKAWLAGLPQPGMSAAEAQLERRLAERLLSGGTVFEDPQ